MINYIIQIVLCQILFLAVYDLFLSKETFFTKNRLYLISTAILSFVLPLLRIPTLQKAVPQEYVILLPEVLLSPQKIIKQSNWYENINYLQVLFWFGFVVFSVVFMVKLTTILRLIFSNEIHPKKNYKLVWLPKNSKAFSFFNYIFLGRGIPQEKQEKIIQHELVHSKQKHSLDLLFFELLKIVMWFNPMIYVYQKRITLVHEFISDEVVTKQEEKTSYINNLLSEIFQVEHISFINQFYKHSLIKKRVVMLTKNKSKQVKQFKYLLLVPVLASMLLYTACSKETEELSEKLEIIEVVENPTDVVLMNVEDKKGRVIDKFTIITEDNIESSVKKKEKVKLKTNKKRRFISSKTVVEEVFTDTQEESVPFYLLDVAPTFPGCDKGDKTCFNKSLREFVVEKFDVKMANRLGLSKGKKRVWAVFKINKRGKIQDLQVRAPHPKLKAHSINILERLPRFLPGEYQRKVVTTGYQLPITFVVE